MDQKFKIIQNWLYVNMRLGYSVTIYEACERGVCKKMHKAAKYTSMKVWKRLIRIAQKEKDFLVTKGVLLFSRSVRFTETNQELGSLGLSWVRVGFEEPNPSSEN